jgi:ferrous iron transport protein B
VLIFLPQICILFALIALLEDSGYLARAAYLVDRLFGKVGLSGHSFIPLLSSFACAVPGIMAARTISDRRNRFMTILVAPLMSCSARLPVYALLVGAAVPSATVAGFIGLQGLVMLGLYLVGPAVAVGIVCLLRRTTFRGPPAPFLLELPSYKVPSWRAVGMRVYLSAREFLVRAGTVIFAVSLLIWALGYYPRPASIAERHDRRAEEIRAAYQGEMSEARTQELRERLAEMENAEAGAHLEQSFLGRAGRAIAPIFQPLGWDWKITTAVLAAFPAREVAVSALGVIYNLGAVDETSATLREKIRGERWPAGRPVYTPLVAVGIMVFFALCAQCASTLVVIRRETGQWGWALFAFCYMTAFAYVGALLVYQGGCWLGWA